MPTGPQSASAVTNFPRGIETGVDWVTELIEHARERGCTRIEATEAAEQDWNRTVADIYEALLMRKAKSWFTGYNSNVDGHGAGRIRYMAYNGGAPKYKAILRDVAGRGYAGVDLVSAGSAVSPAGPPPLRAVKA